MHLIVVKACEHKSLKCGGIILLIGISREHSSCRSFHTLVCGKSLSSDYSFNACCLVILRNPSSDACDTHSTSDLHAVAISYSSLYSLKTPNFFKTWFFFVRLMRIHYFIWVSGNCSFMGDPLWINIPESVDAPID